MLIAVIALMYVQVFFFFLISFVLISNLMLEKLRNVIIDC